MNTYKKLFVLVFGFIALLGFTQSASAMTPTLSLSSSGANSMLVTVVGDANASVLMYYSGGYGTQNVFLGSTNSLGYFSTTLTGNTYGISQGSLVYVVVNGQQSQSATWSNSYYSNSYPNTNSGLMISNLNLSVGNSITLSSVSGGSLYVSNNSNPNVAAVSSSVGTGCVAGAQYSNIDGKPCYYIMNNTGAMTITALSGGVTTITLCQSNFSSGCNTVVLTVNGGSVLGVSTVNPGCYMYRTLRYGMSGADVSCLQSYLSAKGYLVSGSSYSAYFDMATRNAVILFQRDRYLGADGVVGRMTREALYQ